jgi:hypothetical protein
MSDRREITVGREDERRELASLLSSPSFARAPVLARILSYICEKYFAGDTDSIREYNLGVDALGRSPGFDPETDSIVRVEASRLRRRLAEYYRTEGADHRVQILLPSSGYIPQFIHANGVSRGPAPTNGASGSPDGAIGEVPEERHLHAWLSARNIAVAAGLLALAVLLVWAHPWTRGTASTVDTKKVGPAPAPVATGTGPFSGVAGEDAVLRILAGLDAARYIDVGGRVWLGDRYYTGGKTISRPGQFISRTMDPSLYRTGREGDFRYDIPLKPGSYELRLHFAEIVWGTGRLDSFGDGTRRFDIAVNGRQAVRGLDIVSNAGGPNVADELVMTDLSPAAEDGLLHLAFTSIVDKAFLCGLEIYPSRPGTARPVRLLAGARQYFDSQGNLWEADRYFSGGRLQTRRTAVKPGDESGLSASERWGNFNYAIPVAPGRYTVRLHFSESNFGLYDFGMRESRKGGAGDRLFDVYCNGEALVKRLDVFKEAGGADRPLVKIYRGLEPNAQGKLLLSFVPIRDYAILSGIEVLPESVPRPLD